jgi:hypothetical protein
VGGGDSSTGAGFGGGCALAVIKASIPNEWKISESEEMIVKGKDFTEKINVVIVEITVVDIECHSIKKITIMPLGRSTLSSKS